MPDLNGRGYNVVDIANWFHSLPHLDKSLNQISNTTFDPQNQEYLLSLSVFVGLPISLMIIILILYLFVSICICCCCTDGSKPKNIRIECKVFIFLFGLICGLSFISGLYGDWQIYKGIKSVHNSSQDVVNWKYGISNHTKQLDSAFEIVKTIEDLRGDINSVPSFPSFNKDGYLRQCDQIHDYILNAKKQIKDANNTLKDTEYDSVPNYIKKYGNLFCLVAVCVISALSIVGLVFLLAICSRCVLGCFTVLALISFILCCLLMGVSFGVTVFGSDFCLDDKKWIKSEINNEDINDYLIECNVNNKVEQYLSAAEQFLIIANKTNQELVQLKNDVEELCKVTTGCEPHVTDNIQQHLDQLTNKLKEIRKLVDNFTETADCKRVNKDLNDILDSICTDILKGLVMIFFNTIAASACFAIIVFSSTFALR